MSSNSENGAVEVFLPHKMKVKLSSLAGAYLKFGAYSFGGPAMLHELKALPTRRGWLSEEEMIEGLALVQLYPGPAGVDLVAFVGYRLRGVPGATIAASSFLLPSFLLMLGLSALYFTFGTLAWVKSAFLGLEAIVLGVLLNVIFDLGARSVRTWPQALVALGAFAGTIYHFNPVLTVFAALALGALLLRPKLMAPGGATYPGTEAHGQVHHRWLGILLVSSTVLAVALLSAASGSEAGLMGLIFFKIGSVAFGNGATILPLIQVDVVDARHWLTFAQFTDGIALGQITPGPFLITAAFVGYKLAGIAGAALATFAMFSPSFAMTLIFTELFGHFREIRAVRGALSGVMASFVGLLCVTVLALGGDAAKSPVLLALGAAALVALRYLKLHVLWVFGGGIVLWTLLATLFQL